VVGAEEQGGARTGIKKEKKRKRKKRKKREVGGKGEGREGEGVKERKRRGGGREIWGVQKGKKRGKKKDRETERAKKSFIPKPAPPRARGTCTHAPARVWLCGIRASRNGKEALVELGERTGLGKVGARGVGSGGFRTCA